MKNPYPVLFALIAILSACHQPSKQTAIQPADTKPATQGSHLKDYPNAGPVIRAYTRYLQTLDTADLATSRLAVKKFDSLFERQSPEVCDTGFMQFWDYQLTLNTRDSLVRKFIYPVRLDTLSASEYQGKKLNAREQAAQQKLWDNYFIVQEEEGDAYIAPAWRLVNKHFSPFVSIPMKEVLTEQTKEEKEGFMADAGLMIDAVTLAGRTIWWERFLDQHPHHIYDSSAKSAYDVLLYVMVSGSDNSPVMGYDSTGALTPFYDSAYHWIMEDNPGSRTNKVIKPFWEAVRAKDTVAMKRIRESVNIYEATRIP